MALVVLLRVVTSTKLPTAQQGALARVPTEACMLMQQAALLLVSPMLAVLSTFMWVYKPQAIT
jgi:hypothetical protein